MSGATVCSGSVSPGELYPAVQFHVSANVFPDFGYRAAKCARRACSYSFSEFQASRKEANLRNGNVYYLPDHYPSDTGNFGIAHTGPLQRERKGKREVADATLQLLPVRVTGFNKLASE